MRVNLFDKVEDEVGRLDRLRLGVSGTRLGVSNTLPGVSNTRPGVSNTRPGVSNTLTGVSDTRSGVRRRGGTSLTRLRTRSVASGLVKESESEGVRV